MAHASHPAGTVRALQSIATELDQLAGDAQALQAQVASTLGSTATGADKRMLGGLAQTAGSARGAQQALSAAAHALANARPPAAR